MLTALIVVLLMSLFIMLHELGHLIAARVAGVKVEKFSIGFGKKIFSFTDKRGTVWQLAPILLGGYVSLYGLNKKELEGASEYERKQMFLTQPTHKKIFIIVAGAFFNLVLAVVSIFAVYYFTGVPTYRSIIAKSNLPAVQIGDTVAKIDSIKVDSVYEIKNTLQKYDKDIVTVDISRGGEIIKVNIPLLQKKYNPIFKTYTYELPFEFNKNKKFDKKFGFFKSIEKAGVKVYEVIKGFFNITYLLITGQMGNVLSGPIKVFEITAKAVNLGIQQTFFIIFLLNLSLFFFNILPIPVLDGGYVVIYIVEHIIGRAIPEKLLNIMLYCGLILILSLQLLGFYNDFKEYYPKVKNKITNISLH